MLVLVPCIHIGHSILIAVLVGAERRNIFKLAQGEYIAPVKIENLYAKCKFVAQCFVYGALTKSHTTTLSAYSWWFLLKGDSLKSSLVAIVSVDIDVLKAWAAPEGLKCANLEQLCNDPRARAALFGKHGCCWKRSSASRF